MGNSRPPAVVHFHGIRTDEFPREDIGDGHTKRPIYHQIILGLAQIEGDLIRRDIKWNIDPENIYSTRFSIHLIPEVVAAYAGLDDG